LKSENATPKTHPGQFATSAFLLCHHRLRNLPSSPSASTRRSPTQPLTSNIVSRRYLKLFTQTQSGNCSSDLTHFGLGIQPLLPCVTRPLPNPNEALESFQPCYLAPPTTLIDIFDIPSPDARLAQIPQYLGIES